MEKLLLKQRKGVYNNLDYKLCKLDPKVSVWIWNPKLNQTKSDNLLKIIEIIEIIEDQESSYISFKVTRPSEVGLFSLLCTIESLIFNIIIQPRLFFPI